jgi:hypothetical protein
MAYIVAIKTTCDHDGCRKPATHAVFNRINDRMGKFCKRHGEARLADLQLTENRRPDERLTR